MPAAEALECLWALAADRMHQIEEQLAEGKISPAVAQRLCDALQAVLDVRVIDKAAPRKRRSRPPTERHRKSGTRRRAKPILGR